MSRLLPEFLLLLLFSAGAYAQSQPLAFDVAAIHLSRQQAAQQSSNVPLGPGNVYTPTQGLFSARNFTLLDYVAFAYRITDAQLQAFHNQAPAWVADTHFDIEARTDLVTVTKDQLRLMVRSLLAERFHLAVHPESRQKPVYRLALVTPGATGPKLLPHTIAEPCPGTLPPPVVAGAKPPSETVAGGFPVTCGGIILLAPEHPGNVTIGGRDLALSILALSLTSWGDLGRPVVDTTGLTGTYDFVLTWLPQQNPDTAVNLDGPSFQHALQQQLGLRLEPARADVSLLLLDHIDHLTPN